MTIIDRLSETIDEIAIERKIPFDDVSWYLIAMRLAKKLNAANELLDKKDNALGK